MNESGPDVIAAFAQADLLLLTARLWSGPRRFDDIDLEQSDEVLVRLAEAAVGAEAPAVLATLRPALDQARQSDRAVWQREQTRLFDGPVACPINETGYIRRDKGAIIADICGFYRAFGFEPDEICGEKADHLVSELEFVAVLLAMWAEANRGGSNERVAVVEAAARRFLEDHLGEWIAPFAERVLNSADLPVFVRAADLLGTTWNILARRFGLTDFAGLAALHDKTNDPPDDADATPYECGMAEEEAADQYVALTGPATSGLAQADARSAPAEEGRADG